jgi:5-methylcytosine-specific restriction endonuclease McrA
MSIENNKPDFIYRQKTPEQLKANYNSRIKKDLNAFTSFEDFLTWYYNEEKVCHYCRLTELQTQEIVVRGLLTSNRFPQNGLTGQGQARGMWLEVDRIKPKDAYSKKNCVLACYFCNNDKSDVFDGEDYKLFFQNRYEFLKQLLEKNK